MYHESREMHTMANLNSDMLRIDKDANIPTKKIILNSLYQFSQVTDEATRVTMLTSLIGHILTNTLEKISDYGFIHTDPNPM